MEESSLGGRPSVASTDGTERTMSDASRRPISRDIEHIKSLVGRAYAGGSRKNEGSITAQVFRRKGNTVEVVSKDRIYQELDLLKSRMRVGQSEDPKDALVLSPSELDVEIATPDLFDGREKDQLLLGEELGLTKIQSDTWLERAESRIDSLGSEKDTLSKSLQQSHAELGRIRTEKTAAERALREAEIKTTVLDSQLKDVRTHLDMARVELETVRTERRDAQAKYEWAMAEKNELSGRYDSANGGLQDLKKQLATIERERTAAITAAQEAQQRVADLEHRVGIAETAAYQGNRAHEMRQREHMAKIQEYEEKLDEATHDVAKYERSWKQALQERDSAKIQVEETTREKNQHKSRLDALLAERDGISRELNDAETWRNSHLRQLDSLRSENDHSTNMLRRELAENKAQSKARLSDIATQLATKTKEAQAAQQQLMKREEALSAAEQRYKELEVLIQLKDSETERLREEAKTNSQKNRSSTQSLQTVHSEELIKVKQECEERIQQVKDNYNQKRERMLAGHRAALDQTSKDSETRHEAALRDLSSRHAVELQAAHDKAKADIASAESRHRQALSDAQSAHQLELQHMLGDHKVVLAALKADLNRSRRACKDLEDYAATEIARMQTENDDHTREVEASWETKLAAAIAEHQTVLDQAHKDFQRQLQERDATIDARLASLSAEGDDQAMKVREAYDKELAAARSEVDAARTKLNAMRKEHEDEMTQTRARHSEQISDLQVTHREEHEKLQEDYENERRRLQEGHAGLLEERTSERLSTQQALAVKVAEIQLQHQKAVSELRAEHQVEVDRIHQEHRTLLAEMGATNPRSSEAASETLLQNEQILADARAQHEAAIRELNGRVRELEDALADARSFNRRRSRYETEGSNNALAEAQSQHETATREFVAKIHELEEAVSSSRRELAVATQIQEDISDAHKKQMLLLQDSSDNELSTLQTLLEETNEKVQELVATREAMHIEVGDLRARLDVELVAHAEAERSLAVMRKQRAEEERQHRQSKEILLQKQIADLRKEKENLTQQHRHSISSLLELKPRTPRIDSFKTSPTISEERSDDVVVQKMQIKLLQQELETAQTSLQAHEREQFEIGRQNEFLVKEVETLMARLNSRSNSRADSKSVSPLVTSITVDQTPVSPIAPSTTPPLADASNPKADRAVVRNVKSRQRSQTPSNRSKRSASRGTTPTAHEALFAQKTQIYAGDLQQAKDQLTARYHAQLETLIKEKERRERDMAGRAASEFGRERAKIIAEHEDDKSNADDGKSLRRAEEHLVTELNRQVARKKSQIASKYASDFQKATQAYERHMANLLDGRKRRDEDLSVDPDEFEQDFEQSDYHTSPVGDDDNSRYYDSPGAPLQPGKHYEPGDWADDDDPQWPLPGGSRASSQVAGYETASQQRTPSLIPRAVSSPHGRIGHRQATRSQTSLNGGRGPAFVRQPITDYHRPSTAPRSRPHDPQDSGADSDVFDRQPRSNFRSMPHMASRDPSQGNKLHSNGALTPTHDSNQSPIGGAVFSASSTNARQPHVRQPTVSANARWRRQPHSQQESYRTGRPLAPRTSEPRAASTVRSAYAKEESPRVVTVPPSQRLAEARSAKKFTHSSASLFGPQAAA